MAGAGALNMLLAVLAGAFGAHLLKQRLSPDALAIWQTGVTYHLAHGLGLIGLAALYPRLGGKTLRRSGGAMLAGIVLFSGSLYILAWTGQRLWGLVTPIGGVAFLVAWAGVVRCAWFRAPPTVTEGKSKAEAVGR
jgi:uncharacterized membrane protein YgdD (TMEM256/DUF423 family)